MYRCTYCIVRTTTLVVLSSRIGILKYGNKPKVGDRNELELSETVPRAPPSTKVQAKKKQGAKVSGELSGNGVEHLKKNKLKHGTKLYRSKNVRRTHENGKLKRDVHERTNEKRRGGGGMDSGTPRPKAGKTNTHTTSGVRAILRNMAQLMAAITLH